MHATQRFRILPIVVAVLSAAALGCPAAHTGEAGGNGPAVPATTPAPAGPDETALYQGFTPDHEWRAVLARIGRWKLTLAEEWRPAPEGGPSWAPFDVLVAEQSGDAVRVVADRDDMTYAVWVPLEDLAWVPVETVTFGNAAGDTPSADGPSVRLAGGAPIEVLERQNGWTHVRAQSAAFRAEGWVADALVSRIYRKTDLPVAGETTGIEPAAGLDVRDSPDGRVLATLSPDGTARMRVRALGEAQNGWREILYPTVQARVRGWVRADGLAPASAEHPEGPSHSVSTFQVRGDFRWMQISIGMEVWTAPDGVVFAVASRGTKILVVPDRLPLGMGVTVRTIFGDVSGWIPCEPVPEGMRVPLVDVCATLLEETWTRPTPPPDGIIPPP